MVINAVDGARASLERGNDMAWPWVIIPFRVL
jgi:hypothetical protein